MKVNAFGKTAAFGLGAGVLALGALSMPAQADPPPAGSLPGAGSDTTMDVMQGIAVESGGLMESWHATVGGVVHDDITVKGNTVTRPNGSSEGRDALRRSLGENVTTSWATNPVPVGSDTFDWARSSSPPPDAQISPAGDLAYVAFALDAVTYATGPNSPLPQSFTLAQLQTMYRDGGSVTVGGVTYTPDENITLLIPQSGSGTRAFWASTMEIDAINPPAWVHDTLDGQPVQEHDGTVLETNLDAIAPFSIAQYIAQSNGVAPDRRHNAELMSIDGVDPTVAHPVSGDQILNENFPVTRQVYNIVASADVGAATTDVSNPVIGDGADVLVEVAFEGNTSEVCTSLTDTPDGTVSTIELYGFAQIDNCGDTSLRAYPNVVG
ncbi:hypothetical protein [Jiangella asiatica]|uniref:Uncharacterized protein n=1 Tax=Jiangella asiatica TaxID=2530372 RepID=A0A4R5CQS8_9ACTN|nr:hypothetical protein [Jiangella asiatica]TDE01817.1 hypothetical protein E1269_22685 [Jiangella asiatica]